jgi:hypothetical protein
MDAESVATFNPLAVDQGVCFEKRGVFEQGQMGSFHVYGVSWGYFRRLGSSTCNLIMES